MLARTDDSSTVWFNDSSQIHLFLPREVLIHASYGDLIVAIPNENYKILKKEKEGANWRLQPPNAWAISEWSGAMVLATTGLERLISSYKL